MIRFDPPPFQEERLSVIIPALNEADGIEGAIRSALTAEGVEVIVADGGSTDATCGVAANLGVRVIRSAPGRARQMNAAAREATGDILLFLHADTRLPGRYERAVRRTLRMPGVSAGAFSLGIGADRPSLRFVEYWANWRSGVLGRPYGDQALFLTAATFRSLGGFPDLPIMEDFELVRRLSRCGRVVTVPQAARTSARRWLNMGVLRTTLLNQWIILAYYLGASPETLARWYRRGRGIGRDA